jgi:hypothetical protein
VRKFLPGRGIPNFDGKPTRIGAFCPTNIRYTFSGPRSK